MSTKPEQLPYRLLVAVGSRRDKVCSIGSFARAEAKALESVFQSVEVLEPTNEGTYPNCTDVARPDVIFFHAPALHDRERPWNALLSAAILRRAFPKALFIPIVHEFSEAPTHWKARQIALLRFGHGAVVNSSADFEGVRKWHARVLRTSLGPTLFIPELLSLSDVAGVREELVKRIAEARSGLAERLGLGPNEKWILHPGLLTPGKGVNFLGKLAPIVKNGARLIVMGGQGPKSRDREFAAKTVGELKSAMGERLTVLDSPDDATFRDMLLASDLVVLPYDAGLSERRSSFLSAMCCGANVWTTTGVFTAPLEIGTSDVHGISAKVWAEDEGAVVDSIGAALEETESRVLERRTKNLAWARKRTWDARARDIYKFVLMLK